MYDPSPMCGPMKFSTTSMTSSAGSCSCAASRRERLDMTEQSGAGGWYADPTGRFAQRFFDGAAWTEHVLGVDGAGSLDPVARDDDFGAAARSAGATSDVRERPRTRLPIGLLVAIAGALLIALSLLQLSWMTLPSGNSFDAGSALSFDDVGAFAHDATTFAANVNQDSGVASYSTTYLDNGKLIAAVAALAAVLAALRVRSRLRLALAALVAAVAVWHLLVAINLNSAKVFPGVDVGAWIGAVGLAACAVGAAIGPRRRLPPAGPPPPTA